MSLASGKIGRGPVSDITVTVEIAPGKKCARCSQFCDCLYTHLTLPTM
jgi:hypothetical protein